MAYGLSSSTRVNLSINNIDFNNFASMNIFANNSSYLTLNNCNATGGSRAVGVNGTVDHLTVNNFIASSFTPTGYAVVTLSGSGTTNVTINGLSIVNSSMGGLYANMGDGLSISNFSTTNLSSGYPLEVLGATKEITLSNIIASHAVSRHGIYIHDLSGALLNLTNITAEYNGYRGIDLDNVSNSTLKINGLYCNHNAQEGALINNNSLLTGSYIKNFITDYNSGGYTGLNIQNTPNLQISDGETNYNGVGMWTSGALTINTTFSMKTKRLLLMVTTLS